MPFAFACVFGFLFGFWVSFDCLRLIGFSLYCFGTNSVLIISCVCVLIWFVLFCYLFCFELLVEYLGSWALRFL